MANILWDTAINGCENHKQDQGTGTKWTWKTSSCFQLNVLIEKEGNEDLQLSIFWNGGESFWGSWYTHLYIYFPVHSYKMNNFSSDKSFASVDSQQKMTKWDKDNILQFMRIFLLE